MSIAELMTANIASVKTDDVVVKAAEQMKERDVGFLPVISEGSLRGVITDRDIVLKVVAPNLDPLQETVGDVMTEDVITCGRDTSVEDAARLMEDYQVSRLVIVDKDNVPAGVVSLGDFATRTEPGELSGEIMSTVKKD